MNTTQNITIADQYTSLKTQTEIMLAVLIQAEQCTDLDQFKRQLDRAVKMNVSSLNKLSAMQCKQH